MAETREELAKRLVAEVKKDLDEEEDLVAAYKTLSDALWGNIQPMVETHFMGKLRTAYEIELAPETRKHLVHDLIGACPDDITRVFMLDYVRTREQ
jgi:hypothetical protein